MGYANPLERQGYAFVADACADAGIDGDPVDLPPEEVSAMNAELQRRELDNIFLISPTTSDERVATITEQASGFIYYVALKGVTGAGHLDAQAVESHLALIRVTQTCPWPLVLALKMRKLPLPLRDVLMQLSLVAHWWIVSLRITPLIVMQQLQLKPQIH